MPFYQWDPKLLSVQVKEMDGEHQTLIQKMNALFDAHKAGQNHEEISKLLNDFAGFTIKHFTDEEAYMERVQFEGLTTHRIIHQQLLGEVTKHIEEFKKTGKLTEKFFSFLGVWLTSHIRGIDAKYGAVKGKAA